MESAVRVVFAITGLLGFGLGPLLNNFLALSNGSEIIATALGGTGVIFLALSGYVLTTRKDFSFMGGFLMVGLIIVIVFMVVYYAKGGLIANLALFFNVFFIMGILAQFGTSLTLPGIAGIVLTIGMAIDANVLIFERIKEE